MPKEAPINTKMIDQIKGKKESGGFQFGCSREKYHWSSVVKEPPMDAVINEQAMPINKYLKFKL